MVSAFVFVGCASVKKESVPPVAATTKKAAPAVAEKPVKDTSAEKIVCTKAKEIRNLDVIKKGNGCELVYTKGGKANSVASSSHGAKHCEDSKDKIKLKLLKAGYACS